MRTVPIAYIQPDFEDAIESDESFYINIDRGTNKVAEIKVQPSLIDRLSPAYVTSGELESHFEDKGNGLYSLTAMGKKFAFQTSSTDHTRDEGNWTCGDISKTGKPIYALGNSEGTVKAFDESLSVLKVFDRIHASDITSLRIFPSNRVLLTGSVDMRLKILSLDDGLCHRTFIGHFRSVTDTALIGRGRYFLSSSKDGSIRLWECGSAKTVSICRRRNGDNDVINCIQLMSEYTASNSRENKALHPLSYENEGKFVLAGHASGFITMHDHSTEEQVLQITNRYLSSCNALSQNPGNCNQVFAGYDNGTIALWDSRFYREPIDEFRVKEGTPVNTLIASNNSIYISLGYDTSLKLGTRKSLIDTDEPTFLACKDHQVSKFIKSPTKENSLFAIGNLGLCQEFIFS